MATDAKERIYHDANRLAERVFADLLPHDDDLAPKHNPRRVVPEDLQLEAVGEDTELAEDDVLVIRETHRDSWPQDRRRIQTVREYISSEQVSFALVVSATAKTITVRPLLRPGHYWRVDLRDLRAYGTRDYTERLARTAKSRELSRLGPLADLTARVNAHPDIAAYADAYAAARAQREIDDAEAVNARERAQEAAVPAQEAADRLNGLLGSDVFTVTPRYAEGPGVHIAYEWEFLLPRGEHDHGVTYLHGLAHQGRLPESELDEAVAALRLLAKARG